MKKFAFVGNNGEVQSVFSPGNEKDYSEGQVFGESTVHEVPPNSDPVEVLQRWYRKDGEWRIRSERPSGHHLWDMSAETWIEDTTSALHQSTQRLNQALRKSEILPVVVDNIPLDADSPSKASMESTLKYIQSTQELPEGWRGWRGADNQFHLSDATATEVSEFITDALNACANREHYFKTLIWDAKDTIKQLTSCEDILQVTQQTIDEILGPDFDAQEIERRRAAYLLRNPGL